MHRSWLLIAALAATGACGDDTSATGATTTATGTASSSGTGGEGGSIVGSGGAPGDCDACAEAALAGTIASTLLDATSGLAGSSVRPGTFYAHNDQPDIGRVFALDAAGADMGIFYLTGAAAVDWEDIARGPCDAGSCLFVADIGDNTSTRDSYALYRIAEPEEVGAGNHTVTADALAFQYPDGRHDAEAVLVHPVTGVITVVTKVTSGAAQSYELVPPLEPGKTVTLDEGGPVADTQGSPVTGGDVRPDAAGILLRTSDSVLFYALEDGESVVAALTRTPCHAPTADEAQGEAIAWLADGSGYLTTSEGSHARLYSVACAGP